QVAHRADQLRRGRTLPGAVLLDAQHRGRFEGQPLHDRNVSGAAGPEVHLQGPWTGDEEGAGHGLAAADDELTLQGRPAPPALSRRDFLSSAVLLPTLFAQTPSARFIAALPLGEPGGAAPPPFGRLLGAGLDARQFTDLSPLDLNLAALEPLARAIGPHLLECSGNSDQSNYGLISTADWEGAPLAAVLDRIRPSAASWRVLVSGVDDEGSRPVTSVPGASWIFTRDDLGRATLAMR